MVKSDFYPYRLFRIGKYKFKKRQEMLFDSSLTATIPIISEIMLDKANDIPIHLDKFIETHIEYYILTNALFFLIATIKQINDGFIK